MAGRNRSRTGVRGATPPRLQRDENGAGNRSRPREQYVPWLLVFGADLDLDRLQVPTQPLQAILAAHAGRHFRQRLQARRGDVLTALHAETVLPGVQPFQGRRDTVDTLHQQLARGEADLPALVGLDLVYLVCIGPVLATSPEQILKRRGPTHLAKSPNDHPQVLLQPLADAVHDLPSSYSARPGVQRVCRT